MIFIRIRYKKLGGHYHCRLFTSNVKDGTYAKCGDLVFSEEEWPAVVHRLEHRIDFLPEE